MVLNMDIRPSAASGFVQDSSSVVSDWIALSPAKSLPSTDSNIAMGTSAPGSYLQCSEPPKVIASSNIPKGAMTIQIDPWMLVGKIVTKKISVGVTSYGTLDLDNKSKSIWNDGIHWTRAIKLADDCHSYNVQLKFQPSPRVYTNANRGNGECKLILQAVRPIELGQELQLWFSEDILAMLQVVFLNPSNIQGQNKYICNRCSTLYESPNPLKLHITLACGKWPISTLWEMLSSVMRDTQSLRNVVDIKHFEFKLISEPLENDIRQRKALDLTVATSSENNKSLYRPFVENSAFKPFRKQNVEINGNVPAFNPRIIENVPSLWPINFENDVVQLHRNLMHTQVLSNTQNIYTDDAQIESLVSSLGKAKQGHICLYCGKCYSRKYGLKIHIRTHTGYKPLRCKFCDRPFGDPSNLNKHVRLHAEGNTPYKCDLCGKILVRRRDLERHLKSRHMVEMHPGQNVLSDSPTTVTSEENSNSVPESDMEIKNFGSSHESKIDNILLEIATSPEEPAVKIIDINDKESVLEPNSDIGISLC